jgi:hypothetical protein
LDRLEQALTHYACLTEGDVISIVYNYEEYKFDIIKCQPKPEVGIIDADIKFEFVEPTDYKQTVYLTLKAYLAKSKSSTSSCKRREER